MFTQCPSCKTVFNLKPEQLNAAHGKVRCSRCQTIFNARENLYKPANPSSLVQPPPEKAQVKSDTKKPVEKPAAKKTPPAPAKAPTPPAAPPPEGKPATAEPSSDEWFDLTPSPTGAAEKEKKAPAKPSTDAAKSSQPLSTKDEPNTAKTDQPLSIEDELNADLFKLFDEPAPEAPMSQAPDSAPANQSAETGTDHDSSAGVRAKADHTADEKKHDRPDSPETPTAAKKPQASKKDGRPGSYSLPPQLESHSVSATMKMLFYALSNLILIAALVLQYAYDHRIPLRESETWRPWLDAMCQISDCPMPPKRELSKIELVDNMMQSHPRYQNSLLVTATLINRADFVQPYPIVEITMTDLQQNIVAQRTFRPQEYLAGDIAETGFTPNVEVALMLEMMDPGDSAVGFKFDFY